MVTCMLTLVMFGDADMSFSSLVSDLNVSSLLQNDNLHLFGRTPPDISPLTLLLERTSQLSASLRRSYLAFDPEPRIVSLLKEHTSHGKVVEDAQRESNEYVKTLERLRSGGVRYGEDVPLARDSLPDYVLNRIGTVTTLCQGLSRNWYRAKF
jgi:hypothetical protein